MSSGMQFWLLAGGLTLVVVVLLLAPLLRRPGKALARAEYDLAIYRDQMRELEEEIAQGLISPEEAERARNEIARRILAADEARRQAREQMEGRSGGTVPASVVAAILVPAVALAIYVQKGEPGRPDMPLEQRLAGAVKNNDLAALVKRAEMKLEKNPNDLRGWIAIAPAYERLGQLDKAVEAWRRAIALSEKPDPDLYNAFGEALVRAAGGRLTEEAVRAFREARKLRPDDPMSRYYLAMADLQAGQREKAYEELRKLLADLPPDMPARATIARQVAQLGAALGRHPKGPGDSAMMAASGGPSKEAVRVRMRAMQNASPQERMAMIRNMVEGLDARLKENPDNLGGWLRLIRARKVLGEDDKAREALARARQVFAGNAQALERINALAAQLGLSAQAGTALGQQSENAAGVAASGGPSMEAVRERMRAMQNASPQERMAMIRNMVEGLDARLKENPDNLGGWLRLIRARKVLGEDDKAREALARARQVFAGNAQALERINALAAQLGLSS